MNTLHSTFEPLVDAETTALSLGLHPKTLMRMARENRVPAFHIGRYWMFRPSQIDLWLNSQLQSTVANSCA